MNYNLEMTEADIMNWIKSNQSPPGNNWDMLTRGLNQVELEEFTTKVNEMIEKGLLFEPILGRIEPLN